MNNIFHKSILTPNNNKNHFGVKVSIGILIFSPEMVSVPTELFLCLGNTMTVISSTLYIYSCIVTFPADRIEISLARYKEPVQWGGKCIQEDSKCRSESL